MNPAPNAIVPLAIDDLLERLSNVRRSGEGRWMARCPAHGDKGPSLSVRLQDGTILLHCFSGCSFSEIAAVLGLHPAQFFPPKDPWSPARPRHDPDRRARELFHRLRFLHRLPPPERMDREMVLVGRVLAGGTRALAAGAFDANEIETWELRVLVQAAHELARQGTPRRWFGVVAIETEIDRWGGPGFARRRELVRLARAAVMAAHFAEHSVREEAG